MGATTGVEVIVMGDDRPMRYVEATKTGERVIYRASSLGACARAVVACARGEFAEAKPAWFQEVLDEGTNAEAAIRSKYRWARGVKVQDDQREVELYLGESDGREVIVRGHIDGMTWSDPDEPDYLDTLFEAKKFRPSTWPKFQQSGIEVNPNYPWQVSVYMHALDLDECDFVGGLFVDGEITEVEIKHLAQPPISLKAIRKRVMEWEKLIAAGFDAKEVDCSKTMYPCPYFKLHDEDEDDELFVFPEPGGIRETADVLLQSYADTVARVSVAKAVLKAAEAEKSRVADGIRVLIEEAGDMADAAKKLEGTEYVLSRVRKTIPEHTRKASEQDYFTIKKKEDAA
jgi:hypothetical protein